MPDRGRAAGRLALLALLASAPALAQEVPATGSNYGGAGLIEMRNARFRPDGSIEAGAALRHQRSFWFLSAQPLPFLEAGFRLTDRLNGTLGRGHSTDRAFDLKLRLWQENDWRPALAVGVQDVIGTGLYAGEYVVASKRFWDVDVSLGLGWGRLGTGGDIGNPLGQVSGRFLTRPREVGQGGLPNLASLFRGRQAAVFGGLEWSVPAFATPFGAIEGLRAKLEWSGDALRDERGGWPARTTGLRGKAASRLNAGLQWQPNEWLDAGVHFLHGTDLLFRLSLRLNADRPPMLLPRPAAPALPARPAAGGTEAAVFAALRQAGFRPLGYAPQGHQARIAVEGGRFATLAQVAGRVARAVQGHLPPGVEMLEVEWRRQGVTVGRLLVLRQQLEAAAMHRGSAEEVFAASRLLPGETTAFPGRAAFWPGLSWGVEPRLAAQFGDPKLGLRWQAGLAAGLRLDLGHGVALAGSVAQSLAGNLADGLPSDSRLPHVRSDVARYAREGRTAIPALYAERLWTPAPDLYGRVTAGLLEPMFAGVSAELLWRPHDRPWALGLDLAWVAQREYRQRFDMLGYSVATGHVSAYAELPWWNLYGVVRAGRYLAGDWGGTIELGRRFANGIEIGGFATLTTAPFSQFGEGSFDKGIYLRLPLQVFGPQTTAAATALIRPVQRDGGQRLAVDNPLWQVTQEGRADALARGWRGFLH